MINNKMMKIFRLLLIGIFITLIINWVYYDSSVKNRIISIILILCIFMFMDIFCPCVIVKNNYNEE
jgi:phosphatidylglycerophosphatase A